MIAYAAAPGVHREAYVLPSDARQRVGGRWVNACSSLTHPTTHSGRHAPPCRSNSAWKGGRHTECACHFHTREVNLLARAEVLGADGHIETLEGTTIHPIWSLDRNAWVPLGEIEEGEQLLGSAGIALVLTHSILHSSAPIYNIEVHGEHVYQVGELGVLVHNSTPDCLAWVRKLKSSGARKIFQGEWAEAFQIPGYGDASVYWHAFIAKGDRLHDAVHPRGTDLAEWVRNVADNNGLSIDEILARISELPPNFKG